MLLALGSLRPGTLTGQPMESPPNVERSPAESRAPSRQLATSLLLWSQLTETLGLGQSAMGHVTGHLSNRMGRLLSKSLELFLFLSWVARSFRQNPANICQLGSASCRGWAAFDKNDNLVVSTSFYCQTSKGHSQGQESRAEVLMASGTFFVPHGDTTREVHGHSSLRAGGRKSAGQSPELSAPCFCGSLPASPAMGLLPSAASLQGSVSVQG